MFPKVVYIKRKAWGFLWLSLLWIFCDIALSLPILFLAEGLLLRIIAYIILVVHIPLFILAIWFSRYEEPKRTILPPLLMKLFLREKRKNLY